MVVAVVAALGSLEAAVEVVASPTLLTGWYLAACLADHGDAIDCRRHRIEIRNGVGVVTGACELVQGPAGGGWLVRADTWWARPVTGTAAVNVEPVLASALVIAWSGFRGKTNAVVLLPPEERFRRIAAVAHRAGLPDVVAGRLLSWADVVEERFGRERPET